MKLLSQVSAVVFGVLTSLSAVADASSAEDAILQRRIVGVWTGTEARPNVEVQGTFTLKRDGTFSAASTVKRSGKVATQVRVSGTWKISQGTLTETVTGSSDETLLPVGTTTRDKVVGLKSDVLLLESETGRRLQRFRQ